MFDRRLDTFWQTDAIPPHWICAHFSKQTFLSRLSIFLAIQQDETYTPAELVLYLGNDPTSFDRIPLRRTATPSWME
jgi:anaphase-promoting complex subunit 10